MKKLGFWKLLKLLKEAREALSALSEGAADVKHVEAALERAVASGEPAEFTVSPDRARYVLRKLRPVVRLAEKVQDVLGPGPF